MIIYKTAKLLPEVEQELREKHEALKVRHQKLLLQQKRRDEEEEEENPESWEMDHNAADKAAILSTCAPTMAWLLESIQIEDKTGLEIWAQAAWLKVSSLQDEIQKRNPNWSNSETMMEATTACVPTDAEAEWMWLLDSCELDSLPWRPYLPEQEMEDDYLEMDPDSEGSRYWIARHQ